MNIPKAIAIGRDRGKAYGSLMLNDTTSMGYAAYILEGFENDRDDVMDLAPRPLSGEWAGESIKEIADVIGSDDDIALYAYEIAYIDAWWETVLFHAKLIIGK